MTLRKTGSRILLFTSLVLAAPALAAAAGKTPSIDISLPFAWLAKSGGTMTMSCETQVDGDTAAMMRSLRGQGFRGRYESRDGDSHVTAVRSGDRFQLKTVDKDGDKVSVAMPWPVAECLFGGTGGKKQIRLHALEAAGGFELKLDGENAGLHVDVK